MAITSAQLQTALGDGQPMDVNVRQTLPPYGATLQYWYVTGGEIYRGRAKTVTTTASDNAATQAASVRAQLLATGANSAT